MRLIDADNLDCKTLPKKLYPHLQAILDFIDSQPTVEYEACKDCRTLDEIKKIINDAEESVSNKAYRFELIRGCIKRRARNNGSN